MDRILTLKIVENIVYNETTNKIESHYNILDINREKAFSSVIGIECKLCEKIYNFVTEMDSNIRCEMYTSAWDKYFNPVYSYVQLYNLTYEQVKQVKEFIMNV